MTKHHSTHSPVLVMFFQSDWNDGWQLCWLALYFLPTHLFWWCFFRLTGMMGNCCVDLLCIFHPLTCFSGVMFFSDWLEYQATADLLYIFHPLTCSGDVFFRLEWQATALLTCTVFFFTHSPVPVMFFQTDWNDGRLLCTLVKSVGGDIPGWPNLSNNPIENLQKGGRS